MRRIEKKIECSETPSVVPVRWKVTHRASGESVIVVERLWVDARTAGSRAMGCDKNEVNCTRAEETSE